MSAMKRLTGAESLTGANCWDCNRCGMKVEAMKKVEVDEFPSILIIHLLRFAYDRMVNSVVKMCGRVELPEGGLLCLDFSVCASPREQGAVWYDIVGVVNHHGLDTNNGHYTAHCKHDVDGQWYKFDDQNVSAIDASAVWMPECAYVVCLVRRPEPITLPNPQAATTL
jgi:ubiquitin C-terminal hydrolase